MKQFCLFSSQPPTLGFREFAAWDLEFIKGGSPTPPLQILFDIPGGFETRPYIRNGLGQARGLLPFAFYLCFCLPSSLITHHVLPIAPCP
ncbi:MAG: hypothetical protein KJ808_04420, partial [Acidobacteria bacterium]|nr:hypothetical protein [Acidobacteriota bacterium]